MSNSNPIENIIVVMLENRSFDNILGALYPHSSQFEGLLLDGSMSNTYDSVAYPVANNSTGNWFLTPTPDPGESFADMNLQIFGNANGGESATMGGFVDDWMAGVKLQFPGLPSGKECPWVPAWPTLPRTPTPVAADIMNYFTTNGTFPQLPVTAFLAKSFAVSDAWFGSSPTQTFPNRFFANCGTTGGYVNNVDYACNLEIWPDLPSIFALLDGTGGKNPANWKVYFHDYAIATMIKYVLETPDQVTNFDTLDYGEDTKTPTFFDDLNNKTLPKFSFIEPRYGGINNLPPNSNHPPANVIDGEILLATIYAALSESTYYWPRTLLIITYDEHGGCFDHVVPPLAVAPGGTELPRASSFQFNRYGPRVPAIIVSPYITKGTILRPEGFAYNAVSGGITTTNGVTPFDHTSIIKTVIECFNIEVDGNPAHLTERDLNAPSLLSALDLTSTSLNSPGPVDVPSAPAATSPVSMGTEPNRLYDIFQATLQRFSSGEDY